jgi:hypothetical protein
MEYRFILDLDADNELAKALKDRVESPELGSATALFHRGVYYFIDVQGVSVKIDEYTTEVPDDYAGMVKKIVLKMNLPFGASAALGTYKRRYATACVDAVTTKYVIVVEGVKLGPVNRLFSDIRSGKAHRAHRAQWGVQH